MPACKIPSFWLSPLMIAFLDRRPVDGVWLMVLKRGANSIYLRSMRDFISQRWWGHRSLHLNLRSNALDIGLMHFIRGLWRKKRSIIIIITLVTIAITTTIISSSNSININLFDAALLQTDYMSHCESNAGDTVLRIIHELHCGLSKRCHFHFNDNLDGKCRPILIILSRCRTQK